MQPSKLQFSKGEAFSFGWNTAKSNLKFFILLFLILIAILIPVTFLFDLPMLLNEDLEVASSVLNRLKESYVTLIFYKVWLTFAEGKRPTFAEILSTYTLFPKYLLATILVLIAVVGVLIPGGLFLLFSFLGFYSFLNLGYLLYIAFAVIAILFVISTYLFLKFQFYGYFILALGKDVGPIEALKLSSKITKGIKVNLYIFLFLSGLITLAGGLALIVGLIVAIPTAGIAQAYIFKKLLSQTQPAQPVQVAPAPSST